MYASVYQRSFLSVDIATFAVTTNAILSSRPHFIRFKLFHSDYQCCCEPSRPRPALPVADPPNQKETTSVIVQIKPTQCGRP